MEKYNPQDIEQKIYKKWETAGCFKPEYNKDKSKGSFSIVIPPPNVTGYLHIGHALVNSLQDIIVRKKRMEGYQTLWLPGTDHAGIATQMVVEKSLAAEGIIRKEIGKEAFVQKIWEWKEKHGNQIYNQLKRLGASLDWSRERFTLDEGLSKAVRKSFVQLYQEGLIYRAEYLVNWCPKDQTALSDLEVEHLDLEGEITQIRYPLVDNSGFIEIATTRPETMLGDSAVAVHPTDEKYKNLIGKYAIVPLVDRKVPIIADGMVDNAFGTGAVKISPAHDPNDFLLGKKLNLKFINVFTTDAKLNEVYAPLQGLDRFVARKKIISLLKEKNLWVSTKKHQHRVGYSQRSRVIVEPRLSTQWFCKMKQMAEKSLAEVENGNIRFYPDFQKKIFYEWLENIQDWCISRQLWWGHPIPAWHCQACNAITVAEQTPTKCQKCNSSKLQADPDVLDTWYSSGLFPFSTMGWPDEKAADFQKFYPNALLITGYDILFFWVARMIMLGLKFTKKVPFPQVILHGLVRDEKGEKMSKTKGNVIDPLEIIEQHGADALRFALCSLCVDSRDLKLPEQNIIQAKFFLNKLWNATNFVLHHLEQNKNQVEEPSLAEIDKYTYWVFYQSLDSIFTINQELGTISKLDNVDLPNRYRFFAYADSIYNFTWGIFCDWYIEWSKPILFGADSVAKKSALYGITKVLETILQLLHPVCPFITEHLWQKLPTTSGLLAMQQFPTWEDSPFQKYNITAKKAEVKKELLCNLDNVVKIKELITKIRNIKGENHLQPKDPVVLLLADTNSYLPHLDFNKELLFLKALAGVEKIERIPKVEKKAGFVLGHLSDDSQAYKVDFMLDLRQNIDIAKEQKRLSSDLQKHQSRKEQLQTKLSNPQFVEKAPAELVKANQQEVKALEQKINDLEHQLKNIL